MILKEHELLQIDETFIGRLREQDPDALAGLSMKLVSDLKEALERLNQNPSNSSRPSGSLAPWDKGINQADDDSQLVEKKTGQTASSDTLEHSADTTDTVAEGTGNKPPIKTEGKTKLRKPGRQKGS
jgi:hypothetical protein